MKSVTMCMTMEYKKTPISNDELNTSSFHVKSFSFIEILITLRCKYKPKANVQMAIIGWNSVLIASNTLIDG